MARKTDFYRHFTVIVGGYVAPECCTTLRTTERYLPVILRELGVVSSVSELRRNRPDLVRNVDGCERVRIGRKVIDIFSDNERR